MGQKNLCGCNENNNNQILNLETNLSKIPQYDTNTLINMKYQLTYKEQRTKAGTLWEEITDNEKIFILIRVKRIIKAYRNYIRKKKTTKMN